jgi:hypothetical protein
MDELSSPDVPGQALAPRPRGRVERVPEDWEPGRLDTDEEPVYDWSAQLAAIKRHQVTLAALALIVGSLIWKAVFIGHYFYWWDDFDVLDTGLRSHLSWSYLTHVDAGHFFPGVYLVAWVLARVALYNWFAGSLIVLALLAAASLAAWRVLRSLTGNRPAILIPLTLYLFSPLAFPTDAWWVTAVEAIPLQIALFMALNSHLRYVRSGRLRYAVASAAWQFFGLFFFEKAIVIPVLLFAVTAGFLIGGRLRTSVRTTVTRLWKGWLIYIGLLAAYLGVLLAAFSGSSSGPQSPVVGAVGDYAWSLTFRTLVPGLLGGPWHWFGQLNSADAFTRPGPVLSWLAAIVAITIIAASIVTRPRAWRAWVILAAWVVLADIVLISLGRLSFAVYAGLYGAETRYVVDVPAVLAIVVALVFWPVSGLDQEGASRTRREYFAGPWKWVAVGVVGVFAVGTIISVHGFQTVTTTRTEVSDRVYIENATSALAQAPAGTVIVSQHVPDWLMSGNFDGHAVTRDVLGPLTHRGSQIGWTSRPVGTIDQLRIFGLDGRLWPAGVFGFMTAHRSWQQSCLNGRIRSLRLPFMPFALPYVQTLRIGYVAAAGAAGTVVTVQYGPYIEHFTVLAGVHNVYFAVERRAPRLVLSANAPSGGLCFGQATAGLVGASDTAPIPSTSAR